MSKPKIAISVFILLIITAGAAIFFFFRSRQSEYPTYTFGDPVTSQEKEQQVAGISEEYYKRLAEECKQRESFSCCMASVGAMEAVGAKLAPGDTLRESGCPEGTEPNMMRCPDSFRWCHPSSPSTPTTTQSPVVEQAPTVGGNKENQWATFPHPNDGYSLQYPADQLEVEISSAGDTGWIWSAYLGYTDRLGTFIEFFTYSGGIREAIDAQYKNNKDTLITNKRDIILNGMAATIVTWQDVQYPDARGEHYIVQYQDKKVLIIGRSLADDNLKKLFDQIIATLRFSNY